MVAALHRCNHPSALCLLQNQPNQCKMRVNCWCIFLLFCLCFCCCSIVTTLHHQPHAAICSTECINHMLLYGSQNRCSVVTRQGSQTGYLADNHFWLEVLYAERWKRYQNNKYVDNEGNRKEIPHQSASKLIITQMTVPVIKWRPA